MIKLVHYKTGCLISRWSGVKAGLYKKGKIMKMMISRNTGEVTRIDSFEELKGRFEGVTYRQHWQVPGYVLVEVDFHQGVEVKLFHPETKDVSGHVDVLYRPKRHDGQYGVDIQRYAGCEQLDFADSDFSFSTFWPDGKWDLIITISEIEMFLATELESYVPQLGKYIARTFLQTPKQEEVLIS